jgi:phosphoglycerate dehydrogenase-like enzyme
MKDKGRRMKLVIATEEGDAYFGLLDGIPNLDVVRVSTQDELLAEVADADILYGRPDATVLAAAKKLKLVQSQSAGVDFLMNFPELVESDVVLSNTRGAHAPSIAEHAFGLLLSLTRKIPASLDCQRNHQWRWDSAYREPREIMGSTIGILGYGQIGRAIAQRASGFEVQLLAVDANPGGGDRFVDTVWPVDRLHDMLALSDILMVAAPLTRETHHLLGAREFAAMPKNSIVIAVSRGGIIDEPALAESLTSGHLWGAGLDVFETEPAPPDSPFWEMPNVVVSHHLAGSSWQKERRCAEILVENVRRLQDGAEPINVVDKKAGY